MKHKWNEYNNRGYEHLSASESYGTVDFDLRSNVDAGTITIKIDTGHIIDEDLCAKVFDAVIRVVNREENA